MGWYLQVSLSEPPATQALIAMEAQSVSFGEIIGPIIQHLSNRGLLGLQSRDQTQGTERRWPG